MTKIAWLIERCSSHYGGGFSTPQYAGDGIQGWTTDHMKAIRFQRKIDADNALKLFKDSLYLGTVESAIVTEHQWVD